MENVTEKQSWFQRICVPCSSKNALSWLRNHLLSTSRLSQDQIDKINLIYDKAIRQMRKTNMIFGVGSLIIAGLYGATVYETTLPGSYTMPFVAAVGAIIEAFLFLANSVITNQQRAEGEYHMNRAAQGSV